MKKEYPYFYKTDESYVAIISATMAHEFRFRDNVKGKPRRLELTKFTTWKTVNKLEKQIGTPITLAQFSNETHEIMMARMHKMRRDCFQIDMGCLQELTTDHF